MGILNAEIKGIKCDNSDCDFIDTNVDFNDYDQWLNKPCPECGANLLTEADYRTCKAIISFVKVINILTWPLGIFAKKTHKLEAKMDGTGRVYFDEIEEV